jgi:predicted phage terminase large subunit-like protein
MLVATQPLPIPQSKLGPKNLPEPSEIEKHVARHSPASFASLTSKGRWKWVPHLDLANETFLRIVRGEINRLLITMPPRHGKSEFFSTECPAWYTCSFPDNRVILASYAAEFAATWGRKSRGLVAEFGLPLFGVQLRSDSKAADAWEIEGHQGGMQTCGVGGPLTGKGANLLIIDDPVKNAEEANSELIRENTWEWYKSTAYTRLEPGGAIVLIQTRWHEDDLAGRILAHAKETGEEWTIINLPAFAEPGDALGRQPDQPLWPERYDRPALEATRKTIGSYWFSALYQQRPVPPEGGMFKKAWFRYYTADNDFYRLGSGGGLVRADHCRRFGTMDLAFSLKKTADYTVLIAWAVTPRQDLILLDMLRARVDAPDFAKTMRTVYDDHKLGYIGVEKMLGASMVAYEARRGGMAIRLLIADIDKISRSIPAQVRMEAGQIYIPLHHPEREAIEHELMSFPFGAHDDIVDCFSYAAVDVARHGSPATSDNILDAKDEAEKMIAEDRRKQSDLDAQANPDDERWWDNG